MPAQRSTRESASAGGYGRRFRAQGCTPTLARTVKPTRRVPMNQGTFRAWPPHRGAADVGDQDPPDLGDAHCRAESVAGSPVCIGSSGRDRAPRIGVRRTPALCGSSRTNGTPSLLPLYDQPWSVRPDGPRGPASDDEADSSRGAKEASEHSASKCPMSALAGRLAILRGAGRVPCGLPGRRATGEKRPERLSRRC